ARLRPCVAAWSLPFQDGVVVVIRPGRPAGGQVEGRGWILDQRRTRHAPLPCHGLVRQHLGFTPSLAIEHSDWMWRPLRRLWPAEQRQLVQRRRNTEPERHEL